MKKKSIVKSALFTSSLTFLLTLGMLGGTTYAYFTDSLQNNGNVIKSGTLKLDFEHLDKGGWVSLKENPNHQVFNFSNFEPGLVQMNQLKVTNEGSLAFKYALRGAVKLGTMDVGQYGEKLSDVVDVYVSFDENAKNVSNLRDSNVWNYAGLLSKVLDSKDIFSGVLLPEDSDFAGSHLYQYNAAVKEQTITIAMRMREGIGFRYQNLDLGELLLTLDATQFMYEKDGLNDDSYDKVPYEPLLFEDGVVHEISETVIFDSNTKATDIITASGEGTIVNITGGYYDVADMECAVRAKDGAVVNIYGGTFICNGTDTPATSANHKDLIYAGANGGKVNIYGGTFISRNEEGAWLLNERDYQGSITVYGGEFYNWNPSDNVSEGTNTNFLATGTAILVDDSTEDIIYKVIDRDWLFPEVSNNVYSLIGSTTVYDDSSFWKIVKGEGYTVNGNNNVIEGVVYEGNPMDWWNGWIPLMSPVFSSTDGSKVTVNDLTFTGTMSCISVGHDSRQTSSQGEYAGPRGVQNTEFNNVKIIDVEAFSLATVSCCALASYGKATYNNCVVTGTKRSPLDLGGQVLFDMLIINFSQNTLNNCKVGSILTQSNTYHRYYNCEIDYIDSTSIKEFIIGDGTTVKRVDLGRGYTRPDGVVVDRNSTSVITVKDGGCVEVLDVTFLAKNNYGKVVIEDGGIVKQFIDGDKTFDSYDEWKAYRKSL